MSDEGEDILSDDERLAMLSQVFGRKPVEESKELGAVRPSSSVSPSSDGVEVKSKDSQATSPAQESFGSLLEQTLMKRNVMDKEENVVKDDLRKQAIDESRQDMIGTMCKQFFKC